MVFIRSLILKIFRQELLKTDRFVQVLFNAYHNSSEHSKRPIRTIRKLRP